MADHEKRIDRLATVIALVAAVDRPGFGRTALMKCAYILQTLKNVPLGYRFGLYTYGPYDSDVLQDLEYATRLDALDVEVNQYSTGYGYSIRKGRNADAVCERASRFLDRYRKEIQEVADEFGKKKAARLELDSTVVYVARSSDHERKASDIEGIVRQVESIKPRYSKEEIREATNALISSGHISV